jgi:hypothetical protein
MSIIAPMKRNSGAIKAQMPVAATTPQIAASTLSGPTVAIASAEVAPEYLRLPQQGQHDPMFGLTRSYLNLLILPSKEIDFQPPVRR